MIKDRKEKVRLLFANDYKPYIEKLRKLELKFKLKPGDIMMFDNHRLLHGRTAYDANEGARHLQGCYLEFDATDGKLRHLARKFS